MKENTAKRSYNPVCDYKPKLKDDIFYWRHASTFTHLALVYDHGKISLCDWKVDGTLKPLKELGQAPPDLSHRDALHTLDMELRYLDPDHSVYEDSRFALFVNGVSDFSGKRPTEDSIKNAYEFIGKDFFARYGEDPGYYKPDRAHMIVDGQDVKSIDGIVLDAGNKEVNLSQVGMLINRLTWPIRAIMPYVEMGDSNLYLAGFGANVNCNGGYKQTSWLLGSEKYVGFMALEASLPAHRLMTIVRREENGDIVLATGHPWRKRKFNDKLARRVEKLLKRDVLGAIARGVVIGNKVAHDFFQHAL